MQMWASLLAQMVKSLPAIQETQISYDRAISSVQFSRPVLSYSLWPHGTSQASLSITNYRCLPKLMSIMSVMPSNHLILCHPFSCPQSFPESGFFQMSQFFTSGGQSIEVSASTPVLPMNTKDWLPLGWTGWISLQSKGLSRVFSNITVQKHHFFGAQLSSYPTLTSIHDYWKNHGLD